MTISEKALADLLLNYFTSLEPVGKGVTLKNEMKKEAQPDGSTKVKMVPTKGDAYLPKDISNAMAKSIAKALYPELGRTMNVIDAISWSYLTTTLPSGVTAPIEALYQLDGTSDYLLDRSSAGRDLTMAGAQQPGIARCNGLTGRAFFDDTGGHLLRSAIDVALKAAAGASTVEVLLACQGTTSDADTIFDVTGSPYSDAKEENYLLSLRISETVFSNRLFFFCEHGAGVNVFTYTNLVFPVGETYLLTVTKNADGVTHNCYMDGVLIETVVASAAATDGDNARIYVGGMSIASTCDAIIYSVRLVFEEFTATQVLESFQRARKMIT